MIRAAFDFALYLPLGPGLLSLAIGAIAWRQGWPRRSASCLAHASLLLTELLRRGLERWQAPITWAVLGLGFSSTTHREHEHRIASARHRSELYSYRNRQMPTAKKTTAKARSTPPSSNTP